MRTSNRVFLVVNLLIGAFLLGSMSSQSVSASESNAISACANKSSGALRISSKCTKSEKPITWGKTGPKGDSAYIQTKVVTIHYIGDGKNLLSPCGDGQETFSSMFGYKAKTYDGWFSGIKDLDWANLTSNGKWIQNPYCEITLKVIQ